MDTLSFNRFYRISRHLLRALFCLTFVLFLCYYVGLIKGSKPKDLEKQCLNRGRENLSLRELPRFSPKLWIFESPTGDLVAGQDWRFSLFQGPQIELRGEDQLAVNVYNRQDKVLELQLKSLEPIPYRLQLEGYVTASADSYRFFVRESATQRLYRGIIGEKFPAANFELSKFDMRDGPVRGVLCRYPVLTVKDTLLEKPFELSPVEKTMNGDICVVMGLQEDGNESRLVRFDHLGQKEKIAGRIYELTKIDQESSTVTFQRTDLDGTNPKIEIYGLQVSAQ